MEQLLRLWLEINVWATKFNVRWFQYVKFIIHKKEPLIKSWALGTGMQRGITRVWKNLECSADTA